MNVNDKVAVVTGGASGIGLALRTRFAKEGAHVVLSDLDQAACERHAEPIGAFPVAAGLLVIFDTISYTVTKHASIGLTEWLPAPRPCGHRSSPARRTPRRARTRSARTTRRTGRRRARGGALRELHPSLSSDAVRKTPPPVASAGRAGSRLGKVSELTIIVPFAPGGAERLRAFLRLFSGNLPGADDVGTVHGHALRVPGQRHEDALATAYDGDWDAYIDDFAPKIPDFLDIIDSGLFPVKPGERNQPPVWSSQRCSQPWPQGEDRWHSVSTTSCSRSSTCPTSPPRTRS